MPAVLRQIGAPFVNKQGVTVKPKAIIGTCEYCGWVGAPFGQVAGGRMERWCGWRNGAPACVGKGRKGDGA